MVKSLVRSYVSQLTTKDLEKYAKMYNISYTQDELIIVYQFIKYHYEDLLNENIKVFEEIKNKISPTLYKQLLSYYIDLKQKYINKK